MLHARPFSFLLGLIFLPYTGWGGDPVDSLLWKITSPGGGKPSYVYGTMHLAGEELCSWDKAFHRAFRSCDIVAGEINLINGSAESALLRHLFMKDSTLSQLLPPEQYDWVMRELEDVAGLLPAEMLNKTKPAVTAMLVMESGIQSGDQQYIPDVRIQRMAKERNMEVVGLEDTEVHFRVFDYLSYRDQARWLLELLERRDEILPELEKMKSLYLTGRIDQLGQLDEFGLDDPVFEEKLLHDRNAIMLKGLLQAMKRGRVFCAVGAAHLSGESGLIHALRQNGFVVEPVPFRFLLAGG